MPKEFDIGLTVTLPVDNPYGGTYTLQLGECTGIDDLDVRRETGFSLMGLCQEQNRDIGMMAVTSAVVVWLERRKQFPHVTFRDIAQTVKWGSDFDLRDADQPDPTGQDDDEGKAQGSGPSPTG